MTIIIFLQVFARYVLKPSLPRTQPGAVMVMGRFICLRAAIGAREGCHPAFDVALPVIRRKLKLVFFSICELVVLALAGGNKLPSLGISGACDFAPLVVGGELTILFSIKRLARRIAGLPTARFGLDDDPNGGPGATRMEA